jgi:hypothetical protein
VLTTLVRPGSTVTSITHTAQKRNTDHHIDAEHVKIKPQAGIATRTPSNTATADRSHTFVTTMLDAGVDLRDVQIAARACRSPYHHALRPGPQPARPASELHPGRLHGLRHLTDPSQGKIIYPGVHHPPVPRVRLLI